LLYLATEFYGTASYFKGSCVNFWPHARTLRRQEIYRQHIFHQTFHET